MLRVFHHYFSSRKTAFFFAETAAIALTCSIGAMMAARALAPAGALTSWHALLPMAVVFVLLLQFTLYLFDLYDLRVAHEDRSRGQRILKAAGAAALLVGTLMLALRVHLPEGALLGGAVGAFVGTFGVRFALRHVVGDAARVFVIGEGASVTALQKAIDEGGEDSFKVVGVADPRRLGLEGEALCQLTAKARPHYVVIAGDATRTGAAWEDDLVRCRFEGIKVYDAAGFCERVLRRMPVAHLRAPDLATSDELTVSPARRFFKRAFDLIVATVLLVCAAPVMLVLSAIIKLDSKGPVFYRQERVGKNGRPYQLWKFRSMRTDAEKDGAVWARQQDDRVTRVGKFIRKTRLDEVPQVFNVLAGDMSFVGPRPERPVFVDQLKTQIPFYGLREGTKPGITGWAQIRYPYGASVEDARNKLEFDLYYVKNGSLPLDLAIIFHTVRHVLVGRGAR